MTVNAKFIEQHVFKASAFADKNANIKKGEVRQTLYYKVIVKYKGINLVFTSSEYFELERKKKYDFVIGKRSMALVDVCIKENKDKEVAINC